MESARPQPFPTLDSNLKDKSSNVVEELKSGISSDMSKENRSCVRGEPSSKAHSSGIRSDVFSVCGVGGDSLNSQKIEFSPNEVNGKDVKWLKTHIWNELKKKVEISGNDSPVINLFQLFPHFLADNHKFTGDAGEIHYVVWSRSQEQFAFNVKVQLPDNTLFVTSVRETDSIRHILLRIEEDVKIGRHTIHLCFANSHALAGNKTMTELRIPPDSMLKAHSVHGTKATAPTDSSPATK